MYSAIDLFVCLSYFVLVVVIGFLTSRRQRTSVSGYFRADNRLPWYVIGFSIVAAGISSEQFVGEMGYAYKLGMPVVNWEISVFPSLTILLWFFVPLYVRHKISTMPEFLELRFGGQVRTLYAYLTIASYVLINFALVFYTGGFALGQMWGVNKVLAVWLLALVTGAYTVYGGLTAMAWTSSLQCLLLLGGGIYVFLAGMHQIHWDFAAVLSTGQRAHLLTPADHEVPWTALVILAISTNTWYYVSSQYINQRCLAARDEWHAKMGVLFAGALQLLIPLAVCFPGLVYRVINPHLENPDAAYPMMVAAVVPAGLRGLVVAAVLSAIMSTISGLVNSTSTLVTLDIIRRGPGRHWPEDKLVRVGRWSGALALLVGALIAPVVMKWSSIFRYAQDLWAPMAAPIVVLFLAAALWRGATPRGALLCLWLSILTVPVTLAKAILADYGIHFLPPNLENPMVFAGAIYLGSIGLLLSCAQGRSPGTSLGLAAILLGAVLWLANLSPVAMTLSMLALTILLVAGLALARRRPTGKLWDTSMLKTQPGLPWHRNLGLWWLLLAAIFFGIYAWFW